eukprot:s3991_g10.t1
MCHAGLDVRLLILRDRLYHEVAEELPENDEAEDSDVEGGANEADDDEDQMVFVRSDSGKSEACMTAGHTDSRKRYLPPGSMRDQFQQFLATGHGKCSWYVFWYTWKQNFPNLVFRGKRQHAICSTCTRHRLLISCLDSEAAKARQRLLYERHLSDQYKDREVYWQARSQSRRREATDLICVVCDSIDQAKFAWPRAKFLLSKQFDSFHRPRLHVTACLAHGYLANLFMSHSDVRQCGSTTVEILAHTLSEIKEQGVDIAKKNIHVQLDNASSTNKNGTVFAFMGACTQLGIVKSFTASFLRVGHTHEDTLQHLA